MKKFWSALCIGAFVFLTSSGVFASGKTMTNTYLELEKYPQYLTEVNPVELGQFEIKNTSGSLITLSKITLQNKGNLNLSMVADLVLDLGNGETMSPTKIIDNNFIFDVNFNIEANAEIILSLNGSLFDVEKGEYVQMEISLDTGIVLASVNDPFIVAPKKSQLRIIGDEMGDYSIMKGHENLPLLAFHIESDELTLVKTLKLFLDRGAGENIPNMRTSFVGFKLLDNERQEFVYPTGDLVEDGLSFDINSDVWVSGKNYFALFMDTSEGALLNTSIRFRLEPEESIIGAKFLTTKSDVIANDIDYSNILGSTVYLVEKADALLEIPDLPDGIEIDVETAENTNKNPLPVLESSSASITVDNSKPEAVKALNDFVAAVTSRAKAKSVYLAEKDDGGTSDLENLDDLSIEAEIAKLIDLENLEFFPDTDPNSLEGIAAAYLRSEGIIGGYPDGEFKGDRFVNRAELTKFLLLGANKNVLEGANGSNFPDVEGGAWYEKYVVTSNLLNIVNGYPDGTFQPSKNVNTVEFLKMITNSFYLEKNLQYMFIDVDSAQWFAQYVGTVTKYNLFPRRDRGELEPAKEMSRYEVAVAIFQILMDRLKN